MLVLGFTVLSWAIAAPVGVVSLVLVPTYWTGRPLVKWFPHLGGFGVRAVTGQTKFRVRPLAPRPAGTLGLPGDAARLRVVVEARTGAGLIHDPVSHTLTAVARVEPQDSFILAEGAQQDQTAGSWGRLLASFCTDASSGIHRVQVLLRAVSDGGEEINSWFQDHGTEHVSQEAHETYGEYLDVSRTDSVRHQSFLAISLNMKGRAAGQSVRQAGGGVTGGAVVLRNRMHYVRSLMAEAGIRFVGWASAEDDAVITRTAFDPDMQPDLEAYPKVGRGLVGAGPMSVDEAFTYLRTESGYHRVMWVVEWPRKATTTGFLQKLVIAQVRHTFSMIYEPIPTQKAIRQARTESTGAETSRQWEKKTGAADTPERRREREALAHEEEALVAGHGAVNYAGLVTVSAASLDELRMATDEVKTAAARSSCELRVIGGEQASAFIAAALPFGRGL
jgi:hypothetical protein